MKKYWWTHSFDGQTFSFIAHREQEGAWIHYNRMRTMGTDGIRIGITHRPETKERLIHAAQTAGKAWRFPKRSAQARKGQEV